MPDAEGCAAVGKTSIYENDVDQKFKKSEFLLEKGVPTCIVYLG